jgi:hypothetical protein
MGCMRWLSQGIALYMFSLVPNLLAPFPNLQSDRNNLPSSRLNLTQECTIINGFHWLDDVC